MDFKGSCCNYSESSHLAIMMGTRYFNRHEKASLVLTALTQGPLQPTAVTPSVLLLPPETDTLQSELMSFPVHGLRITGGSRTQPSIRGQAAHCSAHPPPWPRPGRHRRLRALSSHTALPHGDHATR